jgi:hypothetical protein
MFRNFIFLIMASVLLTLLFFTPTLENISSPNYLDDTLEYLDNESSDAEVYKKEAFTDKAKDMITKAIIAKEESFRTEPVKNSVDQNLALTDRVKSIDLTIESEETVLVRPPSLYSFPPLSFEYINLNARNSLVNIICTTGANSLTPISASGVLIDPRGVILTNAHVGQYFLLEKDPRMKVDCHIRTGSPARSGFRAELAYLPPTWINEHAHQITEAMPTGTGEHDWAILRVTKSIDGGSLPDGFPFVSPDTREAAGFTDDSVLLASYPAGFIGGSTVQHSLYSASTITNIKKLYTFATGSVDLLSLGGVIVAQGGSSGGAVINEWNHLIGVIVTSSDAETTSERDLRAITIAHIDRSLKKHTGKGLLDFLSGDIFERTADFQNNVAPELTELLIEAIK